MRVDFVDKVENDAHGNQQARAAKEASKTITDVKRIRDERRNNRDYSKEGSADVRNAQHNLLKVIRRAATGAISLDEGAASLEIIRHILGIERDSRPEVAEEVNERDV